MPLVGVTRAAMLLVMLVACSRVSHASLVGLYELTDDKYQDSLELRADGTYVHRFATVASGAVMDTGTWVMEVVDSESHVTLNQFRFGMPPLSGRSKSKGFWTAEIDNSPFGIRFLVNSDMGLYYKRL
jgi:hypothetical protein